MRREPVPLPLLLFALAGCTPPPPLAMVPASGPSSGYYAVDVTWHGAAPTNVTLGGVVAWVVSEHDGGFTIEVQGAPDPGPATLRFETADGFTVEAPDAFTYEEPIDPAFDRMAAAGASISAGMESAGLTPTMARQSTPAVLARLSGAYLGLPLLADGLFPPLSPADVVGCDLPDYGDRLLDSFTDAMDGMRDADGDIDWSLGRRDVTLELRNLAVPGAGLEELADGPAAGDVGALFFAHLFHEPDGALTDAPVSSQLDHLAATDPTLVVATDLLGNDLIDALTDAGGLDPSQCRPLAQTRPALQDFLATAAGTGAWVFVADQPRPSILPLARDAVERSRAAGVSEDAIAADLAEIDALAEAYSAALREDAAAYDNVVVVPLAAAVEALAAEGLAVDGTVLTTAPLGGLAGLDGVHFTATANAWVANVFADTIDATLGTTLPRADLAAVLVTDPSSPAALGAAGLDPTGCAP